MTLTLTKPTIGGSQDTWGQLINNALDDIVGYTMPSGGIIMWSGAVSAVPTGWALCNGSNGTPNLTGKFIVMADADSGGTYNVNNTGGANDVTLSTGQMPSHTHSGTASSGGAHTHTGSTNTAGAHTHTINFNNQGDSFGGTPAMSVQAGSNTKTTSSAGAHSHTVSIASGGAHTHTLSISNTGSGSSHENRPPYYALAYIMKT